MIKDKIVVYTAGTFDMLHFNHLKMIDYARALGDILIVGVNTDELVASYNVKSRSSWGITAPTIPYLNFVSALRTASGES